jgi:hypothetical protein
MRWRRVGFCGLAWDVNVKDVERLALREGPDVMVLRVRERRGAFMGFERWKLDRRVGGSPLPPRAPSNEVRSILANAGGPVSWKGRRSKDGKRSFCVVQIQLPQLAEISPCLKSVLAVGVQGVTESFSVLSALLDSFCSAEFPPFALVLSILTNLHNSVVKSPLLVSQLLIWSRSCVRRGLTELKLILWWILGLQGIAWFLHSDARAL